MNRLAPLVLLAGCLAPQTQVLVDVAARGTTGSEQIVAAYHTAMMTAFDDYRNGVLTRASADLERGATTIGDVRVVPVAQVHKGFALLATKLDEVNTKRNHFIDLKRIATANFAHTREALYYLSDIAMRQQATMTQLQSVASKVLTTQLEGTK